MGLLKDSTFLIRAERSRLTPAQLVGEVLEEQGDVPLAISVMSAGELLHGCWRADSPARRAHREESVEAVISILPVVAITLPIMRVFAEIDARLRGTAPTGFRLADRLDGAFTRRRDLDWQRVRHFDRVPGLVVHCES